MRKGKINFDKTGHLSLLLCAVCMIWTFSTFSQTQIGTDIADGILGSAFGSDVSLNADGNVLAVGAFFGATPDRIGKVRVYDKSQTNTWVQRGSDIAGASLEYFGSAISLNDTGDVVAVLAPLNSSAGTSSGQTTIYEYTANTWTQIGVINGETGDHLSLHPINNVILSASNISLNAAGDIVAIGAPRGDGTIGKVSIYKKIANNNWTKIGSTLTGQQAGDEFGVSVSLNKTGDIVAIGSIGLVKIYQNISDTWVEIASLDGGIPSEDKTAKAFGSSVSLNGAGDIVAIGVPGREANATNKGETRIYQNNAGTWNQIGGNIDGETINGKSGSFVDLNAAGDIVAIGDYEALDGSVLAVGHTRIFQNINGTWYQMGSDIDGEGADSTLGASVSLDDIGSTVAVGMPYRLTASLGEAKVYNNLTWSQKGADIEGQINDNLGSFVSLNADGDILAIGSDISGTENNIKVYKDSNGTWNSLGTFIGKVGDLNAKGDILATGTNTAGQVNIYKDTNGTWSVIQTFNGGGLGTSVSLNAQGDIIAMGYDNGSVQIYQDSGGWTQIGGNISNTGSGTNTISSISLNAAGDIVAIGQSNINGLKGHVEIYRNIAGAWVSIGAFDGQVTADFLGHSVSLSASGNTIAIGGFGGSALPGFAKIYENVAGVWTQIGSDITGASLDFLGHSVSLNDVGNRVAVGAPRGNGIGAIGYTQLYQNVSGTWIQIGRNVVGEAADDRSGFSISLNATGDIVAIGAPLNDSNGSDSGHVRVYSVNHQIISNAESNASLTGQTFEGTALEDRLGTSVTMNDAGDIMAYSSVGSDANGTNSGQVKIFQNTNGTWTEIGNIVGASGQIMGSSISLNAAGDIIAIGSNSHKVQAGGEVLGTVQIYQNNAGTWEQIGTDIDGEIFNILVNGVLVSFGEAIGSSVSLNATGDILAIGIPFHGGIILTDPNNSRNTDGRVKIYQNIAGTWTLISDFFGDSQHLLGTSVSLNALGDIVAIGADDEVNTGVTEQVKIYKNNGPSWDLIGSISGFASEDSFGKSVSLNAAGDIVAIGASEHEDEDGNGNGVISGYVRIYRNNTGTWEQIGSDLNGSLSKDQFGTSVSLNAAGDIVTVGAPGADTFNIYDAGGVFTYQNNNDNWNQISVIYGENDRDEFGTSVSVNAKGNKIIMGADDANNNNTTILSVGKVRVYTLEETLTLELDALLSGPYSTANSLMNDGLRVAGLIPTTSPYGDNTTLSSHSVFNVTGNNAIVDWVQVKLRDKDNINTVLETKAALLQRDGDIVDVDGVSNLKFVTIEGDYFVSVKHRNHLEVVIDAAMNINSDATSTANFKIASNLRGTTNAVTELTTGVYGLIMGEIDGDKQIQTADLNALKLQIGKSGYRAEDMDMNGQIQSVDVQIMLKFVGLGIQF